MAFSPRRLEDLEETSEINLTPFIDVILVLLIIFMVAAQASNVSQSVDLPSSSAKPLDSDVRPVVVTVRADHSLNVNDKATPPAQLAKALSAAGVKPEDRVLLLADRNLPYEGVIDALDTLRTAGFSHIALVGRDRQQP